MLPLANGVAYASGSAPRFRIPGVDWSEHAQGASGNVVLLPPLPRGPGRVETKAGDSYWSVLEEVESGEAASLCPWGAQCLPGEVVLQPRELSF